jgi:hypothetical protein
MSKKQNFLQPECILDELGIELVVMKSLQNVLKVLFMLFFILGVDQCHTRFLCQNHVLVVCMTQDQLFHTYGQKFSQIT